MTGFRQLTQIVALCDREYDVVGELKSARGELGAAIANGEIIATGGRGPDGFFTSDTLRITNGTRVVHGQPLPSPRGRHAMASSANGDNVFVSGGVIEDPTGVLHI